MTAIGEWGSSTVAATFLNQDGTMASGTWTASVPVDLRSATGTKRIILAGVVASGNFTTTPGGTSLSFACPSNADPDLMPTTPAWQPIVTVITGGATRVYVFDVPVGGTLDLHDYVPTTSAGVTSASQSIALGVPGGVPLLNAGMDGLEDANGTPLAIGGGTADWTTLANKPAVIAAGATQAAARSAISAGTSSLTLGTTGATAKAGDYQPAAANITDSTATGRAVLTAASATAARTAIGAGTSDLALGSTETTAAAGDHGHLIAGVNGLQAALDAKAATATLPTTATERLATATVVISSTVLAQSGLNVPMAANKVYDVGALLYFTGDGTADIKAVLDGPAGATCLYMAEGPAVGATGSTGNQVREARDTIGSFTNQFGSFSTSALCAIRMEGWVACGSTAGDLVVKFAQGVSTAVDTTLLAGSTLTIVERT